MKRVTHNIGDSPSSLSDIGEMGRRKKLKTRKKQGHAQSRETGEESWYRLFSKWKKRKGERRGVCSVTRDY